MSPFQQQLQSAFPEFPFRFDFSLAEQTYFKVGGPADAYIELSDRKQVIALVAYCRQHEVALTVLGGASNVIISDKGIRGVVLKITDDSFEVGEARDGLTEVRSGAGLKTALLVRQTVDAGLMGLEFFLGVPGTVGGAVYNNAHYLNALISEHISRVEVLTADGSVRWLSKEECDFGYDHSRFQTSGEIILRAEFLLPAGTKEMSQEKIREATVYRAQTQPLGLPSSGCIFQNTPNTPELRERFPQFAEAAFVPGGFLIDQAGLKRARQGDIEVSDKHAAFFVNLGDGKAADIKTLIHTVKNTVKEQFGVELHEEVFWLGEE